MMIHPRGILSGINADNYGLARYISTYQATFNFCVCTEAM